MNKLPSADCWGLFGYIIPQFNENKKTEPRTNPQKNEQRHKQLVCEEKSTLIIDQYYQNTNGFYRRICTYHNVIDSM